MAMAIHSVAFHLSLCVCTHVCLSIRLTDLSFRTLDLESSFLVYKSSS